jgi:sporulation protein YlmC with PRC-barrel domain
VKRARSVTPSKLTEASPAWVQHDPGDVPVHDEDPAMQQRDATRSLIKLVDTGLTLADPGQDIRDRKVVDADGNDIGHVSALFVDEETRNVRMLEIAAGGFLGFGERHVLLPVDAIVQLDAHAVHVNQTREKIINSPGYDPELVKMPVSKSYWEPFYGYYGLSPYWGPGYSYPTYPIAPIED